MTCRSPGTKSEHSAYSQSIVRIHCKVDLWTKSSKALFTQNLVCWVRHAPELPLPTPFFLAGARRYCITMLFCLLLLLSKGSNTLFYISPSFPLPYHWISKPSIHRFHETNMHRTEGTENNCTAYLFQIFTDSAAPERTAILSELKANVLTSLRWPPMVILDARTACGTCADRFTVCNSMMLFWSSNTIFSSSFGERIMSNDLFDKTN